MYHLTEKFRCLKFIKIEGIMGCSYEIIVDEGGE